MVAFAHEFKSVRTPSGEKPQYPGFCNKVISTDHLGSVREMTDSTGAIRARYDYDPYGRITKVSGDLEANFGFTGFCRHQASGLNLTLYRAYDADLGRWLSRDPIEEEGGINLYGYCGADPINAFDPFGLKLYTIYIHSGDVERDINTTSAIRGTIEPKIQSPDGQYKLTPKDYIYKGVDSVSDANAFIKKSTTPTDDVHVFVHGARDSKTNEFLHEVETQDGYVSEAKINKMKANVHYCGQGDGKDKVVREVIMTILKKYRKP